MKSMLYNHHRAVEGLTDVFTSNVREVIVGLDGVTHIRLDKTPTTSKSDGIPTGFVVICYDNDTSDWIPLGQVLIMQQT